MKLNLVESKADRQYVMDQNNAGDLDLLEMLKKYGEVVDYMTEPMVADFFKVDKGCIMGYGNRNGEELSKYGYKVVKGEELKNLRQTGCLPQISSKTRSLRLYPIKAVMVIGMMLTESAVAARLRNDIMNKIFKPKDDIEQRVDRLENMVMEMCKTMQAFTETVGKLVTSNEAVEQPKVEQISFNVDQLKTPYTATKIASMVNRDSRVINKILYQRGVLVKNNNGGWKISEKYEKLNWGRTASGKQFTGTYVRYTEKGLQEIVKIFNK